MQDHARDSRRPREAVAAPKACHYCGREDSIAIDGNAWACTCGTSGALEAVEVGTGGRRTNYAGKVRGKPLTASVTPECHLMVARLAGLLGLSKSDVVERACRALFDHETGQGA